MPKVHQKGRKNIGNKFLDTIINRVDGSNIFVLGNAKSEGIPVVYCSEGFYELTGFRRSQVRGKRSTCSFLYGSLTKDEPKQRLKDALQSQQECRVQLCLYTKSGEPFWCGVEIVPITNENHEVVLFLITFHKFVRKETFVDMDNQANEESLADQISQTESSYPKRKHRGRQVLFNLTRQFKSRRKKIGQLDKLLCMLAWERSNSVRKGDIGKKLSIDYNLDNIQWRHSRGFSF